MTFSQMGGWDKFNLSMWLFASEVSADYYAHPPGSVSLLMLTTTHIQAMALILHIHTQCRFNNHTALSSYRIMVTATRFVALTKMGYIGPRVGLKLRSMTFQVSVLPLHHVRSLKSPLCPRPPVYVAL